MKRMQATTLTLTLTSQQAGAQIGEQLLNRSLYLSDDVLWVLSFWLFVVEVVALAGRSLLATLWPLIETFTAGLEFFAEALLLRRRGVLS